MSKITFIPYLFLLVFITSYSQSYPISCNYTTYDPVGNRFFCNSDQESILSISPNGDLSYFGDGLRSDIGIEIIGEYLVTVIGIGGINPKFNEIKIYDINTELEVNSFVIEEAQIFFDLTTDKASKLWTSEIRTGDIYEIDLTDVMAPTYRVIANLSEPASALVYDRFNNKLIYTFDISSLEPAIKELNLDDFSTNILYQYPYSVNELGGIALDDSGNFYASVVRANFNSRVVKFSNDFSSVEQLNIPGLNYPRGLTVANEINILAIPSNNQDEVVFWPLEILSNNNFSINKDIQISLHPNPSKGNTKLEISKANWLNISGSLSNIQGQIIQKLNFDQTKQQDSKKIDLDLSKLSNGYYLASFSIDNGPIINKKIIINH